MTGMEIAMLGNQAVSLLSGANNIAAQNRLTIGLNNISLGYLQEQLNQLPEMTQLSKEASREKMLDTMDTVGMESGIQWQNISMSMDAARDVNKFSNYGQLTSQLDMITEQQRQKFRENVKTLRTQSNIEIAQAEAYEISEQARIDNQIKLLKKQNQEARKRDTMFEALFG
jgi:hypothetical protein